MTIVRPGPPLAFLCAAAVLAAAAASADGAGACTGPEPLPDGNTLVTCRHVRIEIEAGADLKLTRQRSADEPRGATLSSGAVYVEDHAGGGRGNFAIRTPDAIASVRGTTWAVDVSATRSSVFVVEGIVRVRRRLDGQGVSLAAGQGVDVAPETDPLAVKRWPAERVAALLARFGR